MGKHKEVDIRVERSEQIMVGNKLRTKRWHRSGKWVHIRVSQSWCNWGPWTSCCIVGCMKGVKLVEYELNWMEHNSIWTKFDVITCVWIEMRCKHDYKPQTPKNQTQTMETHKNVMNNNHSGNIKWIDDEEVLKMTGRPRRSF